MRTMTIADLRKNAIYKLATRKNEFPTLEDLQDATRLMNSFYRLAGLDERLLYLQNSERTCNLLSTQQKEIKAFAWYKRLDKELREGYNARIKYFGYLPTICDINSTEDLYLVHYYK